MISQRENGSFVSHSEAITKNLGAGLAKLLRNGDVISLTGPLGAGKTCFIKGLATGMGIPEEQVSSPSYTLVNEYQGRNELYHFDLYRLKDASELHNIGWDEYLEKEGIVAVEWGEKADGRLPDLHIEVQIGLIGGDSRRVTILFKDF